MRYIGSKKLLLEEIHSLAEKIAPSSKDFCDLFAGTGVVGNSFKSTHRIISNDILHFCYVINSAYIGLQRAPEFNKISKYLGTHPIEWFNNLRVANTSSTTSGFITQSYTPAGVAKRQYLTIENGVKVDQIRALLDEWLQGEIIDQKEWTYLLASLLEAVPGVSNTTGTYGAYLKHWDARALKPIELRRLPIIESKLGNQVFNDDANNLIAKITGEVLYLDTPYNGRQYSSNYHLLESLSRYDNPDLRGVTGTRADRSGDSDYCKKSKVLETYNGLIEAADFKHIILSYSSDGILNEEQLVDMLSRSSKAGTLQVQKIPYRRYKRTSNDDRQVTEYLMSVNR